MHAYHAPDHRYDFLAGDIAKHIETDTQAKVHAVVQLMKLPKECPIEVIVKSGTPSSRILETIKERRPDLVVIGNHGERHLGTIVSGSMDDKVLNMSPVSVLVAPHRKNTEIKKIVCAVDYAACTRTELGEPRHVARPQKL